MFTGLDFNPTPIVLRFDSLSTLRNYLKRILEQYQEDVDRYGDTSANLMREIAGTTRPNSLDKSGDEMGNNQFQNRATSPPWNKLGPILIATRDPLLGTNELVLQALEESQFKLTQTLRVLRAFDEIETAGIAEKSSLVLYLKNGVPERLVAEPLFRTEDTIQKGYR
ncbi:MAG: hypothetical protein JRN20_15190 [Nitrososphaerota archaeon]|nr:hypothetical protein [Nitrososphaerota archaeon]